LLPDAILRFVEEPFLCPAHHKDAFFQGFLPALANALIGYQIDLTPIQIKAGISFLPFAFAP